MSLFLSQAAAQQKQLLFCILIIAFNFHLNGCLYVWEAKKNLCEGQRFSMKAGNGNEKIL
jgi:hypothetical protein